MAVYVDASALIALQDGSEADHVAARNTLKRLRGTNETLVIGLHTIYEFADGMAKWHGQTKAADAVARLREAPKVRLEGSEDLVQTALELLSSRPEWKVDFSDCLSFVMMRELGIRRAFTFDSDFEKAGFEVVP